MLGFRDFVHLPLVDGLVERMVGGQPGLVAVAGLDARPLPESPAVDVFLPSGRATVFGIMLDAMLSARPSAHCLVIASDRSAVRIPREFRRRVEVALIEPPLTYEERIFASARRRLGLLVVDRLSAENIVAVLEAARGGVPVLSQIDSVFAGPDFARQLLSLGVAPEQLAGLAWVLSVQRMPTLCAQCKQPVLPEPDRLAAVQEHFPDLSGPFYRATGCQRCLGTGRFGDIAVFDIFRAHPGAGETLLSRQEYIARLAAAGYLPLEDYLNFDSEQSYRMFNLFQVRERLLQETNTARESKLAELEAAYRVLQQRTEALVSLHDLGQVLISPTDLRDMANRICRRLGAACGADRAILYYLRSPEIVETLGFSGWEPERAPSHLPAERVFLSRKETGPVVYNRWPPGIAPRNPDVEGAVLRAGLYVPLIAQDRTVGLMVVHSTVKHFFTPGEVALLQTFANQAALAIQRAELVEDLRAKITQLEAAQVELAQKERMERELELARQVQQSVLPRTFPQVEGLRFAAWNEPARQVGGDLYDVIALEGEQVGIAIADVSDKGMPAALYMALTRSLLRAEARRASSPGEVLASVNQLLLELGEPGLYVTIFYGMIDCATHRLTYARAGHDRPLLLRAGSVEHLTGDGTALGLLDGTDFALVEEQVDLLPGDLLMLYTDGLTDVLSPDGSLFDRERLENLLQSHAGLSPEQLCEAIFTDLASYRGEAEQYDDMTMLVVEVGE